MRTREKSLSSNEKPKAEEFWFTPWIRFWAWLTTVQSRLKGEIFIASDQMGVTDARHNRLIAAIVLFFVVAVLGLALHDRTTPWQDTLGQSSYDSLHRINGESWLSNSPVVLVYLDLASYQRQGLDPLKPWPRGLHAQLIRRLTSEGARAVVFDIVFSGAGASPEGDAALAAAIKENGRVILASECNYDASHATSDDEVRGIKHSIVPPFPAFSEVAAATGLATQMIDDDYSVRRYLAGFSDQEPTLTWAAASFLRLGVTQQTDALRKANRNWLHYYGPPLSIPHVSYAEALDPSDVPAGFFRDKVVMIGARPWVDQFHERQDEFSSPFHAWSKKLFVPGVEVHATEMLNLIRRDSLRRFEPATETLLLLVCAAVFGGGLVWLRPMPATVTALLGAAVILAVACWGFIRGVWMPWLLVSTVQIPSAWAGAVLTHSLEWYRARKRFEAARRLADAKIREQAALIEKAHDAILVEDLAGGILYANSSAERLYGWTSRDLQKPNATVDLFLTDPETVRVAREAVSKHGEWSGELRLQTRLGRIVIVASRWTLIRDEIGQAKALLMISSDITDQKQLEARFLRTQRMNMIGSLAGGMAHDLNNALAPILMGVQLLRRKSSDREVRDLLDLMETSTHRGADMVRQVLSFARGRGSELEKVELATIVRELEKMIRDTFPKKIAVDSFLPNDLWGIQANPTQLYQVLLNLCVNARDAMPDGGKLSFVADNVDLSPTEAAAIPGARPGKFVSLSVADTGMGIPAEVQAKIFEPFFTTKPQGQGTGIGLSTVLRIVQAHQGFLRVESEPGQGTTFEIFLPCAPEITPVAQKISEKLVRGNGELILLADDEQAVRELLKAELTSFGYRVLAAANGEEAVTLFREHAGDVRIFITDGAMPVMDGAVAIRAVRKLKPDLPVILTSGEAAADIATNVTAVSKPFSFDDILSCIQQNMLRS